MVDYQRVVDDIRSFLQSSDQTLSNTLKQLAAEYADACKQVNQRLRRCEEYLQKGLRSEAIHFAQAEPVLLDVLAALDFAERGQWEEVSLTYGLPAPPKLRVATAQALNQAYGEEQPVEYLLRQHRLLALGQAPLESRLAVMRQIAAVDKANPVWAEDVGTFETARFQGMHQQLHAALTDNDMDVLFRLWEELQSTSWSVQPPLALVNIFNVEIPRRRHLKLRHSLEKVAAELAAAFAVRDENSAGALRGQWDLMSPPANLLPEDQLVRHVTPALSWLARLDQRQAQEFGYQSAVQGLERGLFRGASEEELEELCYEIRKYKRRVPKELEDRYLQRLDDVMAAGRRRERYILAATCAFGVSLLVSLILFLATRGH